MKKGTIILLYQQSKNLKYIDETNLGYFSIFEENISRSVLNTETLNKNSLLYKNVYEG